MVKAALAVTLFVLSLAPGVAAAGESGETHSRGDARLAHPAVGTVLATAPTGGINTCGGSKGTSQCIQALRQADGIERASATSAPATGTTTGTAAPAPATATPTVPTGPPSVAPSTGSTWAVGAMAVSIGAAMGVGARAEEERRNEAEFQRRMRESARTLEEVKRRQAQEAATRPVSAPVLELPANRTGTPIRDPGGKTVPRLDSERHAPIGAPGGATGQVVEEPEDENPSALELSNPYGQHGKPDHQAAVERLKELVKRCESRVATAFLTILV